ncbi:MAG TPA: glycosyltransferase family 4 protein [Candidatus Elarobacter sp.]|nr:glycosyltransferase family 4 protein [Candidatus Elarobacter sp.]
MRILHAAPFATPSPGGFIPLIEQLARSVRARGDELAFVTLRIAEVPWHRALRDAGATLHLVDDVRGAIAFARRWRADVTHVHFYAWEPAFTVGMWTTRTTLFWHAHSTTLRAGRARRTLRDTIKYRAIGSRVERFVAVADAIAAEIAALGAPRERIVVVPNEIDALRFRPPSGAERKRARAALNLDGPVILFFGRDPYLKGADVLAAALPELGPVTVLTVATDEPTRAALGEHAHVVAVERVDDVVPLLWAADAIAIPSRGEGMSFVQREARFTGLPAAASDLPALREGAAGATTAFFPVGDAAQLARALRATLAVLRAVDAPPVADNGLERWADRILALYEPTRARLRTAVR